MTHEADVELARRASEANPAAFESLFADTIARVYAFVQRRSPSAESAQRLTERVLLRVFREISHYEGNVALSAWVLSIVKDELRSESRASLDHAPSLAVAPPVSGS